MPTAQEIRPSEAVITTRREPDGVPVVAARGELDITNADRLEMAVRPVLRQGPQRLVFDFSGLRFMDSAGIDVLVRAAQSATTVELHRPSPIVRRLVELTGLTSVLVVRP